MAWDSPDQFSEMSDKFRSGNCCDGTCDCKPEDIISIELPDDFQLVSDRFLRVIKRYKGKIPKRGRKILRRDMKANMKED